MSAAVPSVVHDPAADLRASLRRLAAEFGHARAVRQVAELIVDHDFAAHYTSLDEYRRALVMRLELLRLDSEVPPR